MAKKMLFTCANCSALYHIVLGRVGPETAVISERSRCYSSRAHPASLPISTIMLGSSCLRQSRRGCLVCATDLKLDFCYWHFGDMQCPT